MIDGKSERRAVNGLSDDRTCQTGPRGETRDCVPWTLRWVIVSISRRLFMSTRS